RIYKDTGSLPGIQIATLSPDYWVDPSRLYNAYDNGLSFSGLVVASQTTGNVYVLLSNASGGFQAAVPYAAGGNPGIVTLGDFSNDGKVDIAVTNYVAGGTVTVLPGNGNGTFTTVASPPAPFTTGAGPWGLAAGDFNGDGGLDLVAANYGITPGTTAS